MTIHYPIVLETESSGAVSAYVPGLPVYAAAGSRTKAERAIRAVYTWRLIRGLGRTRRCALSASQTGNGRKCTSSASRHRSERSEAPQRRARHA
jgi:hypothetical protein